VLEDRPATGGDEADHSRAQEGAVNTELACREGGDDRGDGASQHLRHAQVKTLALLAPFLVVIPVLDYVFLVHLPPLIAHSSHCARIRDFSVKAKVPLRVVL
jgi:hypothetical protein